MNEDIRKLKEIIQSSNINLLIGSGASQPFLSILGDIEKKIEEAGTDNDKVSEQLKRYFEDVMSPCDNILTKGNNLSGSKKSDYDKTYQGYYSLFNALNRILIKRKSRLLNKQVNIFTTNIDIFMEKVLEDMNIEYNDGFSGNIDPIFQTSNFHKSIHKISTHFGNISEIPTFNIIKMHGSLSWGIDDTGEKIIYSKLLLLQELSSHLKDDEKFRAKYEELQIVNPSKDKFKQTVMGVTHYDLLRMYSSELEKENSVLFVVGFSMADEHIREITLRVANSNPTLKIYIFCYSKGATQKQCNDWFGKMKYKNIEIITPEGEKKYDTHTISDDFFEPILKTDVNDQKYEEGDKPEDETL